MLKDKVVVITGAARGIGFEIGKCFARNGATVVLSDVDEERVNAAAGALQGDGYDVIGVKCDVTKETEIINLLNTTMSQYGRIDCLINNAGMQYVSKLEDFPTEKFEQLIKIMLTAPFITTKHVFPIMKNQRFGRIINIASINGLIGFSGKAAYNSAKHGVIGLTKVAALEGAEHGITVNAVCPGYVDTPLVRNQLNDLAKTRDIPVEKVVEDVLYPLIPQKRLLSVDEVSSYVMYLASDHAKGITGQACVIDGGYTAQ